MPRGHTHRDRNRYLIIGVGIVSIGDRHGKPGGHWNDAYSFVTLHEPSSFYGVNSVESAAGTRTRSD